ncbi:MAG: DNA repair protein RecO [Rhodothermales bacterium]
MIIRTDAVVLRSLDYGETSEIVTLFTRDRGKLAVMAKGSRRSGTRFGSSLQPMSYTQVVFYYKPSRSVQTLSESSHIRSFHGITRNLNALSHGLRIVELASALMQEEEQNTQVFNLLVDSLDRLHRSPAHTENVLFYFQLHFASILGFAPDIDRVALDELPEHGGLLNLDNGSIAPSANSDARTLRRASR